MALAGLGALLIDYVLHDNGADRLNSANSRLTVHAYLYYMNILWREVIRFRVSRLHCLAVLVVMSSLD